MAARRTRTPHRRTCPISALSPQPRLPPPHLRAWTTQRWRAWPWSGASTTSSATSACPLPFASPSTSRALHSTPSTSWWVIPNIANISLIPLDYTNNKTGIIILDTFDIAGQRDATASEKAIKQLKVCLTLFECPSEYQVTLSHLQDQCI